MTDRSYPPGDGDAAGSAGRASHSESERSRGRLERKVERLSALIDALHDRIDGLAGEVRTRRLVVVDDDGFERVVVDVCAGGGSLVVSGGLRDEPHSSCVIQPYRFMLRQAAGAHVSAMVTADDAEIVVHSGPDTVVDSAEAARVQVHAARGWVEGGAVPVPSRAEIMAIAGDREREDGVSVIGDESFPRSAD